MKLALVGSLLLFVLHGWAVGAPIGPTAFYNPNLGNLRFEGLRENGIVELISFYEPPLIAENVLETPGVSFDEFVPGYILVWRSDELFPTPFYSGNVVPAGRPADEFEVYYRPGFTNRDTVPVITVPEPATIALSIILFPGVCVYRAGVAHTRPFFG